MREVLSLSMPGETIKEIKKAAKKYSFNSVSKYINYLFYSSKEKDNDYVPREQILKEIKKAEKEYEQGEAIKADSLADFL